MTEPMALQGRTIETVRKMTNEEYQEEFGRKTSGFRPKPTVMVLDDGKKIFPSQDSEGNDGGVMFGRHEDYAFRF